MTAVSSGLISRSACAARASVYAAEATRRARSGGIASSRATIRRTVAVSPAVVDAACQRGLGRCRRPARVRVRARRCDGTWVSSTVGRGPSLAAIAPGSIAHVLVRDVRCIDGLADAARPHVDVRLDGDRIAAIEPHDPARPARRPATSSSTATGRTVLLPGLIDAHAHYTFDPTEGSIAVDRPALRRRDRPGRGRSRGAAPCAPA